MDRLSKKILKYIFKQSTASHTEIIEKFGERASASIRFLFNNGYISAMPRTRVYRVESLGIGFLETRRGVSADRWITRICAIIGAVTGTISLLSQLFQ